MKPISLPCSDGGPRKKQILGGSKFGTCLELDKVAAELEEIHMPFNHEDNPQIDNQPISAVKLELSASEHSVEAPPMIS